MASALWLLWALTGGAIATWVMILIWLPDPPPDIWAKYLIIFAGGIIGALVGGYVMQSMMTSSDALSGLVGAAALGSIFSGILAALRSGRASAR